MMLTLTFNNNLSFKTKTQISTCSLYSIQIRFTGGKKAVQEAAKAAGKAASHNNALPTEMASSATATPFNKSSSNTPGVSPKPIKSPKTETPVGSKTPEDLSDKFLKKNDVKFVEETVKNNATAQSIESNKSKNHNNMHQDIDDFTEIKPSAILSNTNQNLIGVYVNNPLVIISDDGQQKTLEEIHAVVAQEKEDNSVQLIGAFTSSKGGTPDGKVNNIKISAIKHNDDFTPIKNRKSNMNDHGFEHTKDIKEKQTTPIVDDYGAHVPDPVKGGQNFRQYPEIINISSIERENIDISENKHVTNYINNNPEVIVNVSKIVKHSKERNTHAIGISEKTNNILQEQEQNDVTKQTNDMAIHDNNTNCNDEID